MALLQMKLKTEKIGNLYFVAEDDKLCGIHWSQQPAPITRSLTLKSPEEKILSRAMTQIEEYLAGNREEFSLPLAIKGTDFQKRVWRELQRIPYGETISYRELAKRIDHEKAVRAVGTANGRNPVSIIIPCHRVIAADGTLGGYAGGLKIKTALLGVEAN